MKAVIGLGFGDEGKGATTDWLCSTSNLPLVVRFSGGHQAGHNVIVDGVQHVFSNFGAGSLRGAATYWEPCCTVDPVGIMNEYMVLLKKGIKPELYINNKCPITTPMDKRANSNCMGTLIHGTCGVGFFETLKREKANYTLVAEDLNYATAWRMKFESIRENYYGLQHLKHGESTSNFYEAVQFILDCKDIIFTDSIDNTNYHQSRIYEGSQGLLLDKDIGFFPHCTPSNTGSKFLKENGKHPKYYLVTRAYQTRHGNGPMTEHGDFNLRPNPNEQNFNNGPQGKFRKSMLDLDLLKYAIDKDGGFYADDSTLVITCLEHMLKFVFWYNGKEYEMEDELAFGHEIVKILGLKHLILCKDHQFKIIDSLY